MIDFKWLINFDTASAVIFLFIILFLIARYRKKLDTQVMVGILKIPLIYAVLYRTKFGLKFMDTVATKYRELVKLIGYCFIGFGFAGLIFISLNIIYMLIQLFITPKETSEGVALVLPLTNIPGLGYLSFWHFLITLFITILIHEFAHGIVARAHKVPVKSSGVGVFSLILPLFPLAFVEPDEKKLSKQSDVVQYSIFAAGPMINIVFAVLIALLLNFVVDPIHERVSDPVGLSFSGLLDDYSAAEVGMQPGMIITKVNGVDIIDYQSFTREVGVLKPGDNLDLTISDGTQYTVTAKASPQDLQAGYIGIQGIRNEREIQPAFKPYEGVYLWFRGLFKWMFFINVAIGLMNLLPLMITDGGRMLKTALERITGKSEQANKIWLFIGLLFIFTLLYAMVINYGSKLLAAIGLG